jgi:hypothetical protein
VSYILPNKVLAAEYAVEFRKALLDPCQFVSLLDFSRVKVWSVSVYPVVPIFRKGVLLEKEPIKVMSASKPGVEDLRTLPSVPPERLKMIPDNLWSFLTQHGADVLLKILEKSVPLETVAEVWGASTVAEGSEYPRLLLNSRGSEHPSNVAKFVVTGSIHRYGTT